MAAPPAAPDTRLLARLVADAVQHTFSSLPKSGKPQPHEHTVLAGIAAYHAPQQSSVQCDDLHSSCLERSASCLHESRPPASFTYALRVVALGTGTKALGGNQRSAAGDLLNDSHAEAICRRSFVIWVYQQLMLAADQWLQQQTPGQQQKEARHGVHNNAQGGTCSSAFYWCSYRKRFRLHQGIQFAMYISQPPCGDASIYTHHYEQEAWQTPADIGSTNQQQASAVDQEALHELSGPLAQQPRSAAVGRTGAKLIRLVGASDVGQAAAALATTPEPQQQQAASASQQVVGCSQQQEHVEQQQSLRCVPSASDVETGPQQLGALRRKPGKGDPTLSLSCSDKLARWSCLGLQGCLLSSCLAEPVYLGLLVIGTPGTGSECTAAITAKLVQSSADTAAGKPATVESKEGASFSCSHHNKALLAAVEAAGMRAFSSRLAGCHEVLNPHFKVKAPMVVAVVAAGSELGLYADKVRRVPSGSSVNWNCQLPLLSAWAPPVGKPGVTAAIGVHEATLAASGRRLGAAKKGSAAGCPKTRSRLCRAAMYERWQALLAVFAKLTSENVCGQGAGSNQQDAVDSSCQYNAATYRSEKVQAGQKYQESWAALRSTPCVFANWLVKW